MAHDLHKSALPHAAEKSLIQLGENLRIARTKRGWTMQSMADSMMVTRKTLSRLEKGDPGVGLGVLSTALFLLGLSDQLAAVASPGKDETGLQYEKRRMLKRVHPKKPDEKELDF